ncbi:MAG: hypothetical protein BWK80_25590 [Desulfobacteraceae bacterium IS3]|nr:MAG: hypothetical protein BWK80_25590 [Desulfobacteraceae bacterium IS3]
MLKSFLSEIKDNRRKEGKRYKPGDILLFSISAIPGGAVSHRKVLDEKFGHERKRLSAYTTIINIIRCLCPDESEECFRKFSSELSGLPELSETEQKAEKSGFLRICLSRIKKWEDVNAIIKVERQRFLLSYPFPHQNEKSVYI